MSPYTLLPGSNGQAFRFRRLHPSDTIAGTPGVVALLKEHFFDTTVLYVAACNDLAPFAPSVVQSTMIYREARKLGCNAIAIMATGKASAETRRAIAESIRFVHAPPLNLDEAA